MGGFTLIKSMVNNNIRVVGIIVLSFDRDKSKK